MYTGTIVRKDAFYTSDHEWIEFRGAIAHIGVCPFKLSGIRLVQQVIFSDNEGIVKRRGLIATFLCQQYRIPIHMSVDGKIIRVNDALLLTE